MRYRNESMILSEKGVLLVPRKSMSEWSIMLIMIWPFIINLLSGLSGLTNMLSYIVDVVLLCWCIVFLVRIFKRSVKIHRRIAPFVLWISCFIIYTFFAYFCNYQSILYYMWGVRNTFRYYIIFFIIINEISIQEAESWLRLLDKLFWINAILSIIQFTVGGFSQDNLGGIFGTASGTNGYTLIFLSIAVVRSQLLMYEKKEKLGTCLLKCATALLVAAMAELKFFFLLFVMLLVVVIVLTEFSWKKIITLIFGAVAVALFMDLLVKWFSTSGKLDLDGLIAKAFQENYATANDLNRLSAIRTLSKKIVKSPVERMLGLGLGNCDRASFSWLRTPFYERYSYLHYHWFAAPMVFLELGYIGLIFYFGFFVMNIRIITEKLKEGACNVMHCRLGIVFAIVAIILTFYNASMKHEAGIMIYIVMAIPFISKEYGLRKGEVNEKGN